ncbi:MAG: hypothetical protein K9G40_09015 [Crocinitomicaceae bacterium]|nr:hypothetical protein [Crocinitomicaceae bacterium]MCF8434016.1 hypothetical protein [Crocinitomicaceae bacterium]
MELISKYNIKEEDLYILATIESRKETVSFFEKEKLKGKSMGVLKSYNVNFLDLGPLLSEIKSLNFDKSKELIEKYGVLNLETKKSSLGLKYILPITFGLGVFFFVLYTINSSSSDTNIPESKGSTETSPQAPTESSPQSPSESEEASKKAYRAGYNDGKMGFGLPASERATAMESYLANNYNFSSADIPVYEMGYNDAIYGKSAQY